MSVKSVIGNGRRLVASTFLDSVFIQDRTLVRDTTGGYEQTWTERAKRVKCRFVKLRDDDPEIRLESVYGRAEAILLLPLGTAYKEGDRVRSVQDNSLWIIVSALTSPSTTNTVNRCGIRQV